MAIVRPTHDGVLVKIHRYTIDKKLSVVLRTYEQLHTFRCYSCNLLTITLLPSPRGQQLFLSSTHYFEPSANVLGNSEHPMPLVSQCLPSHALFTP